MALAEKEKARLAEAGFGSGVIRAADVEAARTKHLALLRLDALWPVRPVLALLVTAGVIFASQQNIDAWLAVLESTWLAMLVLAGVFLLASGVWAINRKGVPSLLDQAPERWAARHLAMLALYAGSRGAQLDAAGSRFGGGESVEETLLSLAAEEKQRLGNVRWYHDAVIVGIILIPLAMVIAVPVLLQRF